MSSFHYGISAKVLDIQIIQVWHQPNNPTKEQLMVIFDLSWEECAMNMLMKKQKRSNNEYSFFLSFWFNALGFQYNF